MKLLIWSMVLSFALGVTTKESLQHQTLLVKNPLESVVVMTEKSESVLSYLGQHQYKHIISVWRVSAKLI